MALVAWCHMAVEPDGLEAVGAGGGPGGGGAAVVVVGAGAGAGAGATVGVASVPARHAATYALSVIPLAWKFALSARHSSVQAFAVFAPVPFSGAVATGGGGGAVGAGPGAAVEVAAVPARHAET